jgi:hypothetical protein
MELKNRYWVYINLENSKAEKSFALRVDRVKIIDVVDGV